MSVKIKLFWNRQNTLAVDLKISSNRVRKHHNTCLKSSKLPPTQKTLQNKKINTTNNKNHHKHTLFHYSQKNKQKNLAQYRIYISHNYGPAPLDARMATFHKPRPQAQCRGKDR